MSKVIRKYKIIPKGGRFYESEIGYYDVLYPDLQSPMQSKMALHFKEAPLSIKCFRQAKGLVPVAVSSCAAKAHSLKTRIVWIEDVNRRFTPKKIAYS